MSRTGGHRLVYPLTHVPYSLAKADGFLTKTDKAKGLHHFIKDIKNAALPLCETILKIEDGNALFRYLREVLGNFKNILPEAVGHASEDLRCDVQYRYVLSSVCESCGATTTWLRR